MTGTSPMNIYLTIGCIAIALIVVVAIVKGVQNLRKHEEAVEQDTGSNYVELSS